MATQVFNAFKYAMARGLIVPGTDVFKAAMLMTGTTAGSENAGITAVGGFMTLDECDASGYQRKTLADVSVVKDDGNLRVYLDASDLLWSALPAATRPILGVLILKFVADDAGSLPICFLQYATPKTLDGSDFSAPFSDTGFVRLT